MRMSTDSVSRKNKPYNEARTKATISISYPGEPYHEHLALFAPRACSVEIREAPRVTLCQKHWSGPLLNDASLQPWHFLQSLEKHQKIVSDLCQAVVWIQGLVQVSRSPGASPYSGAPQWGQGVMKALHLSFLSKQQFAATCSLCTQTQLCLLSITDIYKTPSCAQCPRCWG